MRPVRAIIRSAMALFATCHVVQVRLFRLRRLADRMSCYLR